MKLRITLFATLLLFVFTCFSQTSDKGFSFQGYAIDPDGKALGATNITIRFTISPSVGTGGTYAETYVLTTDPYGVFHAIVGKGTKESGVDFKTLDFTRAGTIYKLKVEVKKTSGGIYTTINEADFNAVPYARKAENGVPVGTIVTFAGPKTKIPEGWALCDGTLVDGTSPQWKQLYDVLGLTWGGSGTNYNLPDLRGMFLRGVNDGRSDGFKDPDAASRVAPISGANSGDAVGSVQTNETKSHTHSNNFAIANGGAHTHGYSDKHIDEGSNSGDYSDGDGTGEQDEGRTTASGGAHSHTITGGIQNTGGNETRPNNAGIFYIIKY